MASASLIRVDKLRDGKLKAHKVANFRNVWVIMLTRPEVRNCVNGPTALSLANSLLEFDKDEKSCVAVLYGSGGYFCAGGDLKAVSGLDPAAPPVKPIGAGDPQTTNGLEVNYDTTGPMGFSRLALSKPVIAAVAGHAVAGGLELACWCDLRVAEEDAVFGVFCRRWGVPLIDGGTVRLTRLIGLSRALDLVLTGRPVAGPEAYSMGLANRLVPKGTALEHAIELATEISNFPQSTMRADRLSAITSFDESTIRKALESELRRGIPTLKEAKQGAYEFSANKKGRHGSFNDFKSKL